MTFSQRMGLVDVRKVIQTNDLDEATRNALWNVISPFFNEYGNYCSVYKDIWTELYNKTSDTRPNAAGDFASVEEHFYVFYKHIIVDGKWNECLDLIEFLNQLRFKDKWWDQLRKTSSSFYDVEAPSAEAYNFDWVAD